MGETPTHEMMGSRTFLLTLLAVSCHGLPTLTGEVVPERQTMLLQHTAAFTKMSPTAFISAMASSGGSETDCRTFADETIKDIKITVKSTQGIVDAVDTGSGCAAMGQVEVTAATAVVTAAKGELETAKTDAATKQTAEEAACTATFQVAPISLTLFKSGVRANCVDISNDASYKAADAACTLATATSATADQAVVAAKAKVTNAEASLAAVVAEASRLESGCLCRVHKAQAEVKASSAEATATHAADWKASHEVICALEKTTTCTVPTCPTVTPPTLADGVANADTQHCTPEPTTSPTQTPTQTPSRAPTRTPTRTPTQTPSSSPVRHYMAGKCCRYTIGGSCASCPRGHYKDNSCPFDPWPTKSRCNW